MNINEPMWFQNPTAAYVLNLFLKFLSSCPLHEIKRIAENMCKFGIDWIKSN